MRLDTRNIYPIDVMTYADAVIDLIGRDIFEAKYKEYCDKVTKAREKGGRRHRSTLSIRDPEPIIFILYKVRESIDVFWAKGQFPMNEQILDIIGIGKSLIELKNVDIVDPSGNKVQKTLKELYSSELWEVERFWDSIFELEMAAGYKRHGFDVKIIYEGNEGGPDLLIEGFDSPIWIECKSKRNQTPDEEKWGQIKSKIIDSIYKKVRIGDDSYYLKISSEFCPEEKHIELISSSAAKLIMDLGESEEIRIDDGILKLEILSYFEGLRKVKGNNPNVDLFSHIGFKFDKAQLEDSDMLNAECSFKIDNDGTLMIANANVIEFHNPINLDYVEWVFKSIRKAKSQLSGRSPSIIHVYISSHKLEKMSKSFYGTTTQHQLDALVSKIENLMKDSPQISAIVISSREKIIGSPISRSRIPARLFLNPTATSPLPEQFVTNFDFKDIGYGSFRP